MISLVCQNTAQICNRASRALDRALPAGQAVIFVDVRKIFTDRDRSGRTDLFAHAAADAGNLAVFPGVFAQILVGAFDDDRVGALVDANELVSIASNLHTPTHSPHATQPYSHSAVARQPPLQATKAA